ncbi:hypothetical protein GJU40_01835 [Bacillus lacus]|uniref:SAM-dependent methyltransferase n=1 Tax=Metabacillus lacus TaxID=1983721 RepID=A0A7X2IW61_9BACI|nr:class I SAM-dependent methyltransferase [Metabacillus lacus]MRX70908.1 hypothetical protein [Metabacillus lacus]
MNVTTSGRTAEKRILLAKSIAEELGADYKKREKKSVADMISLYGQPLLVVGENRLELYQDSKDPAFFHPNSSMFRIKRLMKGDRDPFLEACGLQSGQSLLDCTAGLASDAILASFQTGVSGKVVGIEGNRNTAYLTGKGLQTWETGIKEMDEAMRRIQILHSDHEAFLQNCSDNSFDVVYFDPMFHETIVASQGIAGLRGMSVRKEISKNAMRDALRVAKSRVVLKDHWQSPRFQQFGFSVIVRKTAKFHFGFIEKDK